MSIAARMKDRSPRWAKDLANTMTRQYGMRTASRRHLPDFLVIGTKRGGTTSVWNYLIQHPLVMPMYPPSRGLKSPYYFDINFAKGDTWYRSHFATEARLDRMERELGARPLTGEACPYYMYCPPVAERVLDRMPDVKLIITLRDPVKRAYSHYWERVGAGVEPLAFEQALAAEPGRLAGEVERMAADPLYYSKAHDYYSYQDRGVYLPQLERWTKLFPAANLLILPAEDLYRDEQRTVNRIAAFLGISEFALRTKERHNHLPAPRMADETKAQLTEFFRPHNRALFDFLGKDFGWPS
ncbi:sulfotransferase domain-containing protein [Nonomuraea sp. NPDC059194]|uniref:sulfotransferase domain-containing protein n=1 Tax=Nonomuraea sp. NPDC059194 TaxID=3346764 RepID=UPI0036BF125D